MKETNLRDVKIEDGFWTDYQNKVIDMVIPYQEKILRDQIEDAEKSHAIENFKIAAGEAEGEFYGMVFQDSDVAKWIEGASYSLVVRPDAKLEKKIDEISEIIRKAQREDGYLDTYFIIKEPENRWTNLLEGHELYCAGHMIEAGTAYYEATGKDLLLNVCKKLADHIYDVFVTKGKEGYPGHPEVELALMKLYRTTGEKRYLELAEHFLNVRGVDKEYFKKEKAKRKTDIFGMDPDNLDYNQSFAPVKQQKEAVGHAVRALYMYEAMADVAKAAGDEELADTCRTLWDNIVNKKMFVTGGVGSDGSLESFSSEYYLPNDVAYNETCAQIAMMFFSKKMLDMGQKPDGKYADIMEKLLYNSTISGMQYDGTRFFYVNPLEVNPGVSEKLFGHRHVIPARPRWYACACCPPNLVRMISSLGKYTLSCDDNTIYSHLFIGQEAKLDLADIRIESLYPWKGSVSYKVKKKKDDFRFAIHIPGHVNKFTITRKGEDITDKVNINDGYVYLDAFGNEEEQITIEFDMPVRKIYADDRILADAGKVCFARGPIIYCIEGMDNGDAIQELYVKKDGKVKLAASEKMAEEIIIDPSSTVSKASLKDVVCLQIEGIRRSVKTDKKSLYTMNRPSYKDEMISAVPYYLWANRGLSQMNVWIKEI